MDQLPLHVVGPFPTLITYIGISVLSLKYSFFRRISGTYLKIRAGCEHVFVRAAQKHGESGEMVRIFCKSTQYLLLLCQKHRE